jgi:hypothetical protein
LCQFSRADDSDRSRAAIEKTIPLLQQGAKSFRERSEGRCISCHHQGLILPTIALARERGFAVDEQLEREEIDRLHGFYARRQSRYLAASGGPAASGAAADPFGNFTVHAGYWLWALDAEKVPPDESLAITARLLASKQWPDGHWTFTDTARAPMQASDFTTTALAIHALKRYGSQADTEAFAERTLKAHNWLQKTTPRTLDDKAFRLLGLKWAGDSAGSGDMVQQAADDLAADQRSDGGWAQQANMPSDAYATGLALVALYQAGGMRPSDVTYGRGVDFLLRRQQGDGSWYVKTRAIPTNPYFESGFPHGKSQFISYAATCWATMALLHTRGE